MTFPRSTGHIPSSSHERPTGRLDPPRRRPKLGRYLDALAFPQLPFGFGLTYTTFEYGEPTCQPPATSLGGGSVTRRRSR